MIGQFGVGFYSAFMVSDKVDVYSRAWHADSPELVWTSDGKSGYEIEETSGLDRGSKLVLHLKEDCAEYATETRVKHLIETYSNFVGFPIILNGKRINEVEALWLKNKSEITDEQYKAFYQFACKAWDEPAYRLHFSADAPLAINSLVFAPSENPERMGFSKTECGVALYSKKVLIDAAPKDLLPDWMRFMKGVVDSADIPLNISRETMQDSALIRKLGSVISKRVIRMFEKEAEADPEKYRGFYRKFDRFFKEGVATDYPNREALAKLLRFESSLTEAGAVCGFTDYVSRMKDGQESIYYLVGPSRDQIESSPYIEAFKARGLEVIYFTDAVDEYVVDSLGTFDGKKLTSIRHAGVELEDQTTEGESLTPEQTTALCDFLKEELGDRVTSVSSGKRLVENPVIALVPADGMSPQMRQMMKAMDENFKDEVKVELEINPRHPLVQKTRRSQGLQPGTRQARFPPTPRQRPHRRRAARRRPRHSQPHEHADGKGDGRVIQEKAGAPLRPASFISSGNLASRTALTRYRGPSGAVCSGSGRRHSRCPTSIKWTMPGRLPGLGKTSNFRLCQVV